MSTPGGLELQQPTTSRLWSMFTNPHSGIILDVFLALGYAGAPDCVDAQSAPAVLKLQRPFQPRLHWH